jgi:hypothetical protein
MARMIAVVKFGLGVFSFLCFMDNFGLENAVAHRLMMPSFRNGNV